MRASIIIAAAVCAVLGLAACGKSGEERKGGEQTGVTSIQPTGEQVTSLPDGPTDIDVPDCPYSTAAADIDKGKGLFTAKGCNACHRIGGGKLVGPDLKGVTARRQEKWIEKMVLHPEVMLREDGTARGLFATLMTPMANQSVDPHGELPYLLDYLKANE